MLWTRPTWANSQPGDGKNLKNSNFNHVKEESKEQTSSQREFKKSHYNQVNGETKENSKSSNYNQVKE